MNIEFRDHPFKTSACRKGGGVKNLSNFSTDSTKKLPTVGEEGSEICENAPTSKMDGPLIQLVQ